MANWTCDFCTRYEPGTTSEGACTLPSGLSIVCLARDPICPLFVNRYDAMKSHRPQENHADELPQPAPADPLATRFITVRGKGHLGHN
jgi:hypothetical protein